MNSFIHLKDYRKYLLLIFLMGGVQIIPALAQTKPGSVKGIVQDTLGNKALANATINVLDATDSTLVSFGRSKENGAFELLKIPVGDFLLLVSYTGFEKNYLPFKITNQQVLVDFGPLPMTSANTLDDVVVTVAPMVVKGDTVEFNANSFKVNKPNAVVEDLLKKMPGMEIDKDGVIKVNGVEVKRVIVDGKQFFANDPKLATRNLRADMISKVQVFDKKSDRAEFTGFDDGEPEPTINLTLKADKRIGLFGKVGAGGGTDDRYAANANISKFSKGEQMAFTGQANNVNQQNFGGNNGGMAFGGGGGARGITATQAAGLNYNNFKNEKFDLGTSYFFNHTLTNNDTYTRRETYVGDSTQIYESPTLSNRGSYSHRLNISLDWKIDSANSIKITPSLTYSTSDNDTRRSYNTVGPKGYLLTDGFTNTISENKNLNLGATALWRHKFSKRGRTISTELRYGVSNADGEGSQYTNNQVLQNNGLYRYDTLDQRNMSDNNSGNYGINVNYTEPLSKKSALEISTYHNRNASNSNRYTFDYNDLSGLYDIENVRLTNLFDNSYQNTGTSLSYRENNTGWNYSLGVKAQSSEMSSTLQGKLDPITQKFFNIIPNATLNIGKDRYRRIRLNYLGNTNQPSITQLQPIADITNPLNVIQGNPDLKQSYTNNVRLFYNVIDPLTSRSLMINLNGSQTFNAIVNNDSIGGNGGKMVTFNNVNGVYSYGGNINYSIPITVGESRFNINLGTGGNFNRNINLQNDAQNIIRNLSLNQRIGVNYTLKEWLDLGISGRVGWNNAKYTLNPTRNTNFFNYSTSLDATVTLPLGIVIASDVDYIANTGRAEGYNTYFTLWNASVTKNVFKNKQGEVRFAVNDLLNQNTGINRNTNGNYIEDSRFMVLKRYFMLSFTYNLNKFGTRAPGMRGGGGGGGYRGGGRG